MKAKKMDWWRLISNLVFVLCMTVCIMFFVALITSIVVFNSPYVVVTVKEAIAFAISIAMSLALSVLCMLFLFNSDERDAIDLVRVYDDTSKIRQKALKNALSVYAYSAVVVLVAFANYFLCETYKASLLAFTGKIVLMKVIYIETIIALVMFVLSLAAYVSAKNKFDATKDMILEWENLLFDVEEIACKQAKLALDDDNFVEVYKSAARKKILELESIEKFPDQVGILQVYVGSVFDKVFNEKKWVYVWGTTSLSLFFNSEFFA